MDTMPFTRHNKLFQKLSEVTNYANLTPEERFVYDEQLKAYRDWRNQTDYEIQKHRSVSHAEGKAEGKVEGKLETALMMKADGMPIELICKYTGLRPDQIQ